MRSLGVYPSERALVSEILPEMQDDEPTGFVSYRRFEKKMLKIMANKELEPDSSDLILQAFRTLDPSNTGYVTSDLIEGLLTSKVIFNSLEMFFLFLSLSIFYNF